MTQQEFIKFVPMLQKYLCILLTFVMSTGIAQELDKEDGNTVMRKDYTFGINFNANNGATGWGFAFDYGFQKNYKYKNLISLTVTNIRHPKEFKIFNPNSNSRGYYYGKLESLVNIRPTYGGKRVMYKASREEGIEISAKWSIGPSFGILKPVYLRIQKFNSPLLDEKYDPTLHNTENINSRSNYFKGLSEAKIRVGGFAKLGIDFNFSTKKDNISGGEVGIMIDYMTGSPIVLLNNNAGKNIFGVLYLQFNLGQKLY